MADRIPTYGEILEEMRQSSDALCSIAWIAVDEVCRARVLWAGEERKSFARPGKCFREIEESKFRKFEKSSKSCTCK